MGPKIALVPFLEKTKNFDAETQRAVGRRMVATAVVTALVLFAFGGLLMRLLHITGGAVAVAGGIILAILAINMVSGPGKKVAEETGVQEAASLPFGVRNARVGRQKRELVQRIDAPMADARAN